MENREIEILSNPEESPGFLECADAVKMLVQIDNMHDAVNALYNLEMLATRLKKIKDKTHSEVLVWMKENHIDAVEMGEGIKYIRTREKKEIFKTTDIYDFYSFSDRQRQILEKNPGFRKIELARDFSDLNEIIDVKHEDKLILKKINEKFLPIRPGMSVSQRSGECGGV